MGIHRGRAIYKEPHAIVCTCKARDSRTGQHEPRRARHSCGHEVRSMSVLGPYVRGRDNHSTMDAFWLTSGFGSHSYTTVTM